MRKLALLLLLAAPAFAVLPHGVLYEIRSDASAGNVNGGGFYPPDVTVQGLQANTGTGNTAAPVVGSPNYVFVSTDVGHFVYVSSGPTFYGGCFYQITAVASSSATLNATLGEGECLIGGNVVASTTTGVASSDAPTGGNFVIDYSRSTGSILTATDLASTVGTSTPSIVTSAANPFKKVMNGNFLRITAGTSWIQGVRHIQNVDAAGAATVDRAVGIAASLTNGTGRTGGAYSLGNNTGLTADDAIFEQAAGVPGALYFVRRTTFPATLGGAVTIAAVGTANQRNKIIGYRTFRSSPSIAHSDMPLINQGANAFSGGTLWDVSNVFWYGTAASMFTLGTGANAFYNVFRQKSTTINGTALVGGVSSQIVGNDISCYRGLGISLPNGQATVVGNYIHSSSTGMAQVNAAAATIYGNIFAGNYRASYRQTVANTTPQYIGNNTFYGSPLLNRGGVQITTGTTNTVLMNNIFVSLSTGIAEIRPTSGAVWPSTRSAIVSEFNNFYGNGVNFTTGIVSGLATYYNNPEFTNVIFSSGTTATTSGAVLTQSGHDFSLVVDSQTFVFLESGTGITKGFYGVVGHTANTLTLDIAPGTNATADKRWEMIVGNNWSPGTAMKTLGMPEFYSSTSTVSSIDLGAVQRLESPSSGGGTRGYPFFN